MLGEKTCENVGEDVAAKVGAMQLLWIMTQMASLGNETIGTQEYLM